MITTKEIVTFQLKKNLLALMRYPSKIWSYEASKFYDTICYIKSQSSRPLCPESLLWLYM